MDYEDLYMSNFVFVPRFSEGGKDFVAGIITLEEEDLEGASVGDLEEFQTELLEIFERHSRGIGSMLDGLLDPEDRATMNMEDVDVCSVDMGDETMGSLSVNYEVSVYLGCRDLNRVDELDETLPFEIDLEQRKITLRLQVPFWTNPDPDYDEF